MTLPPFNVRWRDVESRKPARWVRELLAAAVHAVEARDRAIEALRLRVAQLERRVDHG